MIDKHLNAGLDEDSARDEDDPVLAMLGVGKELWEEESGDEFVARLRSEDLPPPDSPGPESPSHGD